MKTHNLNAFEGWNTRREERRIQRARDASWRELRRQQRQERKRSMRRLPAFTKSNIHILLIAVAAIAVLWKGFSSAMTGGSSLTAILCVVLFVALATTFRILWRKDRFERYFK